MNRALKARSTYSGPTGRCVILCKSRTFEPTATADRWFLSVCYPKATDATDKAALRCCVVCRRVGLRGGGAGRDGDSIYSGPISRRFSIRSGGSPRRNRPGYRARLFFWRGGIFGALGHRPPPRRRPRSDVPADRWAPGHVGRLADRPNRFGVRVTLDRKLAISRPVCWTAREGAVFTTSARTRPGCGRR
jgi:hypothetical protein